MYSFFFSLAKDFTVRIWNYEIDKVELVKKYQYDITALALHPSGLFVAIGFSDKLHLMEILLDTMKTVKAFDFPSCDEVVFSHQGHLLACAYGSLITIVSVFSFTTLGSLKVNLASKLIFFFHFLVILPNQLILNSNSRVTMERY